MPASSWTTGSSVHSAPRAGKDSLPFFSGNSFPNGRSFRSSMPRRNTLTPSRTARGSGLMWNVPTPTAPALSWRCSWPIKSSSMNGRYSTPPSPSRNKWPPGKAPSTFRPCTSSASWTSPFMRIPIRCSTDTNSGNGSPSN